MYSMYAERRHWKTELVSVSENGIGGFKEAVFMITGAGCLLTHEVRERRTPGTACA